MPRDYDDISDIYETVQEVEDKLRDAINLLQGLAIGTRNDHFPSWFSGQLEAYTIPSLVRWIDSDQKGQPGNLPGLLRSLGDEDS